MAGFSSYAITATSRRAAMAGVPTMGRCLGYVRRRGRLPALRLAVLKVDRHPYGLGSFGRRDPHRLSRAVWIGREIVGEGELVIPLEAAAHDDAGDVDELVQMADDHRLHRHAGDALAPVLAV